MSSVRQNMVSLLLSQLATFAMAIVTVAVLPKYLGTQAFGALAVAGAYVTFFVLGATLGTGTYLVKVISRDPSQLGRYMVNGLAVKAIIGAVTTLLTVAVVFVVGYQVQTTRIIEISAVGVLTTTLTDVVSAGLQASGRMGPFAVWGAVQRYFTGIVGAAVVVVHLGVLVYSAVVVFAGFISLVAYGRQLWPEVRTGLRLEPRLWRRIVAGGVPFFLWSAVLAVYGGIDILMLQRMTTTQVVGWYSLAYQWVGIPVFFPTLLVTAIFPTLSSTAARRDPGFGPMVDKALKVALLVGTPMAVGIALIAPDIISLFHYPSQFHHVVLLIRILAVHIPVVAMDMILASALTAMDRQKAWVLVGCVAAVFNPAVNLWAIPATSHWFGDGAIGASVVTVATELVMMIGAIVLRPNGVLQRSTVGFSLRCVLASAVMVPPVLAAIRLPIPIVVLIGVAAFVLGAFVFRLGSVSTVRSGVAEVFQSIRSRSGPSSLPTTAEST